jgi:hypothetical protein
MPSSAGASVEQQTNAAAIAHRQPGTESDGEDVIVPSSQPPPESQMSCGFSGVESLASPSQMQMHGDMDLRTESVTVPTASTPPAVGQANECTDTATAVTTAPAAPATCMVESRCKEQRETESDKRQREARAESGKGEDEDDDDVYSTSRHNSVLVRDSGDDDIDEDIDGDDNMDTKRTYSVESFSWALISSVLELCTDS